MIASPVKGTTRIEDGVGIVAVDALYPTPPDELWDAITSPARLARWFGDIQPRSESTSAYDAKLSTGWSGTIQVDECEPPRIIRLSFIDEDEPTTTVTAVLDAVGSGTRLTIEERGLPIDDLATFVAGWHAQAEQLLAVSTGAQTIPWRTRWEQLRSRYQDMPPVHG